VRRIGASLVEGRVQTGNLRSAGTICICLYHKDHIDVTLARGEREPRYRAERCGIHDERQARFYPARIGIPVAQLLAQALELFGVTLDPDFPDAWKDIYQGASGARFAGPATSARTAERECRRHGGIRRGMKALEIDSKRYRAIRRHRKPDAMRRGRTSEDKVRHAGR
jgi:hypothetical protein